MSKNLVIVESPAKARTVGRYLGGDYTVLASLGHVRDLPPRELGVDVERDFSPQYEVLKEKQKVVKEVRQKSRGVSNVYLATDPDREGEAIAWHLVHSAGLGSKSVKRVVFHEITQEAIREAFDHPRDIDENLVNAQQTRRILDRLVGYKLSPVLWQKVVHYYARSKSLSAGRVQSVALRLVADREKEIDAFMPREYWTIEAELKGGSEPSGVFKAGLHSVAGEKRRLDIPAEAEAMGLVADLKGATYQVAQIRKRQVKQRPAAPFTTSSLQQEAWRKLRLSARRTMALAQQLYEGLSIGDEGSVGLITYMRTDSTNVASSALQETLAYVRKRYGTDYAPKSARTYATRSKGAQEAHEAIRPTSVQRDPQSLAPHLSREQLRLYELIWKRMTASQMADAVLDSTSVDIEARAESGRAYVFRASGSVLRFPGFRVLYMEDRDEASDDGDQATLPNLTKGGALECLGLKPEQHFTQPPPRYTEASLIKTLEEQGIGRPSTYAPTISTIQDREYVSKANGSFRITPLGSTVCELLRKSFPDIMDTGFTAQMEGELDEIARGERKWVPFLGEFYGEFSRSVEEALKIERMPVADELTEQTCEQCGKPMAVKMGRFGRFLSCTGYPECRNSKPYSEESSNTDRTAVADQVTDEACDKCERPMEVKTGRYGPFLSCTGYPECRGRKPYQVTTGVSCPRCGGDLAQRRSRKRGRVFYGCSNYPKCDFLVGQRPIPEPCPECGGLLVVSGRNGVRCTACDYRGAAPGAEVDADSPRDLEEVAV
ncbi:MAG: type I DNA topoisomerase [Chloroflexota bacterium]|nr:type I DNA topoisomerase [Chloroflexota bacterium]MDE3267974.1 type I DNA topoisomerase [Chloroflexota bacterium]